VELFPEHLAKAGKPLPNPFHDRQITKDQDEKMVAFLRDAEVLIIDSQYSAEEYESHAGWGHTCVEDAVGLAVRANVKRLFLFHHDPDHSDEQIGKMVTRARELAVQHHSSLIVEAAREGFELELK
jgi:ribonuclease BN (tRNA processing enzyme)